MLGRIKVTLKTMKKIRTNIIGHMIIKSAVVSKICVKYYTYFTQKWLQFP